MTGQTGSARGAHPAPPSQFVSPQDRGAPDRPARTVRVTSHNFPFISRANRATQPTPRKLSFNQNVAFALREIPPPRRRRKETDLDRQPNRGMMVRRTCSRLWAERARLGALMRFGKIGLCAMCAWARAAIGLGFAILLVLSGCGSRGARDEAALASSKKALREGLVAAYGFEEGSGASTS